MLEQVLQIRAQMIKLKQCSPHSLYIDKISFAELRKDLHVNQAFHIDIEPDELKFLGAVIYQVIPYRLGCRHIIFY